MPRDIAARRFGIIDIPLRTDLGIIDSKPSDELITFVLHMYKHLTREQRYAIYPGQQKGETLEIIARSIGVHKSTVSREVRRNMTPRGKYMWNKAHDTACSRKVQSPGNRALDLVLRWCVIELIKEKQWFLTLVERSTNFLLMEKLRHGKKAMPLAKVVWKLLLPYKGDALKTITTDNGSEFAEHEWITRMLNVPVFFADSYSSWQKGAVDNGNKLIMQYISKGTDISSVTDTKIRMVRAKINTRPREKLNFYTPTEVFFKNIS